MTERLYSIYMITKGRVTTLFAGSLGAVEGGYFAHFTLGESMNALLVLSAVFGAMLFVLLQRVFANPDGNQNPRF